MPEPDEPCPMTTDEEDAEERSIMAAVAAHAAGAAPILRGGGAARRPADALLLRAAAGGRPGDRPSAVGANPYRSFVGSFDTLLSADRSWAAAAGGGAGPRLGAGVGAGPGAVRRVPPRWRAWGGEAGAAADNADDSDEQPPGLVDSDGFDDDDDDEECPGLVDEDEITEDDDEGMMAAEGAGAGGAAALAAAPDRLPAIAIDRGFTLSWRHMLMSPGARGAATAAAGADGARAARRRGPGALGAAAAAAPQPQDVAVDPASLAAPQPCSFLRPGARFAGVQRLSHQLPTARRQDDWAVTVVVEGVDHASGAVCGTMQALNVPGASSTPIITFWEGHVIDDVRINFFTRCAPGWGQGAPGREVDLKHWSKFEGFAALK
jgi:hypothetical protein